MGLRYVTFTDIFVQFPPILGILGAEIILKESTSAR